MRTGLRQALRRRLFGRVRAVWHPAFRLPFAGLEAVTGMDPKRAEYVLTWALDRGIVGSRDLVEAPEMPWSWARDLYTAEYLASLDRPETIAQIVGVDAARVSTANVLESWRRAVGGVVRAAELAIADGGRVAVLLGGFHHAAPGHGAGFCALNDIAIAVRRLRHHGFRGRIAVIDVDAHPPDGLAACLPPDPDLVITSLGVASQWKAGDGVIDLRVPPESADEAYLARMPELLAPVRRPALAFVLAGADPLAHDRFGGLACTEDGLWERDRQILAHLRGVPTVLLPAGGYTRNAWRVFAGTIAQAAGSRQRVRQGYDPLLRRSRDVAKALDPHALGQSEDWLDAEDLAAELHIATPAEPRVLGFYTRPGIEYALSRYGILPALSRMGFAELTVETQARVMPHQMRVLARVDGLMQPLVELSVSIRPFERWRTLFVEWLALRDPRVPFTPDRPRLPGQERPGLGMAEEFGHLLVRIAERLGLAGVSFMPAHYHVAWMVRGRFVFADPDVRGRFSAMQAHLHGVALPEASRILDEEGLATEDAEVIRWVPALMIAPIDAELAAALDAMRPQADAVRDGLAERLIPEGPRG